MGIDACRDALQDIAGQVEPHHPGLALHRYLALADDDHQSLDDLYRQLERTSARTPYQKACDRWSALVTRRESCRAFVGALASPLALGLGNETTAEVGLTTHHTYGMPLIPGSALKGLCRRGLNAWKTTQPALPEADYKKLKTDLFGDTDDASYLVFWDAWYVYRGEKAGPFHRDTITVHHPKYYQGGREWPTDFDDPIPVPFLTIKPGVRFLFAFDAPSDWQEFVLSLLQWSLANLGVGGKTNAGYGFFRETWEMLPYIAREIIKDCTLVGNAEFAFLTLPQGDEELTADDWLALTATWTDAQRQSANDGLQVHVHFRIQNGARTILRLVPVQ